MKEFMLFVTYTTKPGKREEFMRELADSGVPETIRRENGCIEYDYYYPVDRNDEILLIEKWETEEHQIIHLTQPHIEELKAIKNKYVTDTKMEKM